MPVLQIVSSAPHSGKSTVATAVAQAIARQGRRVRLERIGKGEAAENDAQTFGEFLFAGSGGVPLTQPPTADKDEIVVVELDGGTAPLPNIPALLAVHTASKPDDKVFATSLDGGLLGSIAVAVDPKEIESVARDLTNDGLRPLALLPEDIMLAAPSVGEIRIALSAAILYDGDNASDVVEDVIIAPVYADPARPHFHRFERKAILAPFNKTDLHLAAITSQAACLVITGGKQPSPYVIDRAQHDSTTVLLTQGDTPATVAALGSVWVQGRFQGENKAAAALALLDSRLDIAGLLRKLDA